MARELTRRQLLREGAFAAGALFAARFGIPSAEAAKRRYPMLGCDTYSVRQLINNGSLALEKVPELLKELDIPGITYNDMFFKAWDDAYLDMLKKAARDAGLTVNCLICEGSLATPDEAARKRQIEENIKKLHAAARLGAPVVRMNLGGVGLGENSDTVGVDRVIAAFNEMLPLARQLKIKITIENHGGVSGSADNILRIIQGTDRKWVGSCLDFGNWTNEARYESCAKLAPYAYHVHAKAHNFNADGEESQFSFGRILAMLRDAKYKGAVSIEWEGGGDPIEGVKRSRDLVRKYWASL